MKYSQHADVAPFTARLRKQQHAKVAIKLTAEFIGVAILFAAAWYAAPFIQYILQ